MERLKRKRKKETKLRYPSLFVLRIEKQLHLPTHLGWYKAEKGPFPQTRVHAIPVHTKLIRDVDPSKGIFVFGETKVMGILPVTCSLSLKTLSQSEEDDLYGISQMRFSVKSPRISRFG